MTKKKFFSARDQRRFDDFAAGVERARKALLEAADQLQDAMEAVSKRRVPCEIATLVGTREWNRFRSLDSRVLAALEKAGDLEELLASRRKLDAAGQAPCPRCGQVLTTDGIACAVCSRRATLPVPD